jgi:hypothetical protein
VSAAPLHPRQTGIRHKASLESQRSCWAAARARRLRTRVLLGYGLARLRGCVRMRGGRAAGRRSETGSRRSSAVNPHPRTHARCTPSHILSRL